MPAHANGQSLVGGRNVNIAGGKQVLSVTPYEVKGDVLNRAQNEPSCAFSTRNPKNVFCGTNDYRMIDVPGVTQTQITRDAWLGEFQSADGGDTWESTLHRGFYLDPRPHPMRLLRLRAAADPTVRSGPAGLMFYSGIAFTADRSRSTVFVSTYADLSTREDDKTPFKFAYTVIPDIGTNGRFIDKPWMHVEAAPAGQTCTINAQVEKDGVTRLVQQTVPGSIIHLAYSVFVDDTDTLAQLMYVRSDNCGATFTRPKQLNQGTQPANGVAITKPLNSTSQRVFTAWRRVNLPTSAPSNAIVGAVSNDNGTTWSAPIVIAEICPFDQATTTVSFRTTAFPSMTADGNGRAYVAWADRGRSSDGQCNLDGAARIRVATSTDGANWTQGQVAVPSRTPEHQILPSIAFTAGRLALAWLDFFQDESQVFGKQISEAQVLPEPGIRHTADVRASMALPGAAPAFDQPTMISEYLRGVGFANGQRVTEQLQWNAVNRRWARRGTVPFNGDYIDIATLPYLPPTNGTGAWIPNNQAVVQTALGPAPRVPLLLVAWTDNRDMRTGQDVDIPPGHDPGNPASPQPAPVPFVVPAGLNLPPGSISDPTQVRIECTTSGDVYKTGTTNQNAYTARATIGVAAGTPANNKQLGNLQRSFVVFVRNDTQTGKRFTLVASQPAGGFATFDQFDTARTTTNIFVPGRSSVSRTVFVTRNPASTVPLDPDAVIRVDVIETQNDLITPVQVTTIYINSDPTAPEIDSPEIDSKEIFSPEIDSPEIDSPEIDSPEIDSRGFSSPEIDSPEIDSPEIDSPEIDSPEIDSNEILSLGLQTPEIDSPEIDSPEIDSPEIDSPEIDSPEIDSSAITDITFKVTNDGNTTGQYNAKTLVGTGAGPGFRYQVIVRRTYALPAVGADCEATTIAVSKVAVNLPDVTPASPEIDSPEIDSPEIDSPEIDSAAIDTASFFVAPDETVEVVVRVRSKAVPTTEQLQAVLQNVDLAVQQEAVNSDDVAVGITEPPVITSYLSVATQALAAGQTTAAYAYALQASGGPLPHQWTLTGGALPPGIVLSADGQLTGSPTVDGTFTFTVQVQDADGNRASRAFALSVTTPGSPTLAFVTQPSNPLLNAVITPYPSVRALTANGTPAAGVLVTVQLVGAGTLVGTLAKFTGAAGIAVFDDLSLTTAASGTALLASAPTFASTTSVTFGTTQADLIIESLTHAPVNPTSADSLTLTAVIKNIGNGPSGPSMVSLLLSGETAGDEGTEFPVPPLAPGATYTVQRLAPPVGAGPTTTSATIDGANTVPESSEGNNTGGDGFVTTPQTAPVVDGLTAWWRAEGDGNDSADGSHGTLIGGVEFGAGRTGGQAFSLDGVNDRIDVGHGFNLDDLTLSAWVFIDPATNQGDRVVISKDNIGGTGTRKAFVLKSSNTFSTAPANKPAFMVLIGNPPDPTSPLVDLLEGPAALSAGWHHLAGVRDTSAGRFEFYIDGVLAASKAPTVIGPIDSGVNTVIGGVNPTFYGQFFAGRIDDAQIFNEALTAEEIAALNVVDTVVHSPVSAPGASTQPLMVRDAQGLGGDANRDLFVLHGNGQVSMMSGNGTGAFTLGPSITIPGLSGTVRDLRVGHVDNLGHPFVNVVTDGATNNVALLTTNGNLGWLAPLVVSMPAGVGAMVNGQFSTALDPSTDLAFVSPTTNQLFLLLNSATTSSMALPGQEPIAIKAGHINKQVDGFLDLVVLNRGSRNVTVLLGNGNGGFTVAGTFPLGAAGQRTPSNSPDALELADFNNDGVLDIAVASDAPAGEQGQSVVVLLGTGVSSFGPGVVHGVGAAPLTLTAADLDNDGNVDIATANPVDNSIAVLHGDGTGNFGPADSLAAGNTPRGIIAVDVTNDGKPELVVANQLQRASVTVDEVSTITSAASGVGPFAVTTISDSGPGSLRQAISNANARPGLDTITFNIPGPGPHVIALTSSLPAATDPIFIDATTQPGYIAAPLVELSGTGIPEQSFGLEIVAGGSTIRGLAIANFAPGDSGHGVLVNTGAGGTIVHANYIGLHAAGTLLSDATVAFGVVAMAPTIIGGVGPAARNVIAGAATSAITLGGGASAVRGNYIGTTADGSAVALATGAGTGIDITQGASYTIDSNVVSGLATGVFVNQPVTGLTFIRNLVGTNAAGNAALQGPTNSSGLFVIAPNIIIGGTTAADGNTIAGYTNGVVVQGSNTTIRNNRIGTSSDGSLLLPELSVGALIRSQDNSITGNTIAGTQFAGVLIENAVSGGNDVSGNVLRDNSATAISLEQSAGSGNTLVPNAFTNNGFAIDLRVPNGPTPNDPGDADSGPNDLQNFPGLTGATPNGATTLVTGVLHSTPNGAFTIHIFQNAFCPASGRGEGTVIGTAAMSTGPDGRGSFSVALAGVIPGSFLSATATNLAGSTSEISDCINVTAPPGVGTFLSFVAQPSSSAVNAVISPAVAVAAHDDGDPVAGLQVTLQLQGGSGLSGTLVRTTDANGVATFDDLSLGLAVTNVTLLATADGYASATSTTFSALLPDLVVQSLTHTPANPATGSPITFNAVVRNAGNAAAVASTARWSVTPGPNAELTAIPALAPGETFAIQRQVTLNTAQDYVSSLEVDFTSLVQESNETNNTASETVTITGGGGGGSNFVVTNTNDAGANSLRQAMLDANATPGADTITFDLEGSATFTITPLSPLPTLTGPVTINGTTQPGYAGTPIVGLNGASAGAGAHGLHLTGGQSVVRGLQIAGFSGHGIFIEGAGGNTIAGNYIGVDFAGVNPVDGGGDGVQILESANNTVGGINGTTPGGACTGDCNVLVARQPNAAGLTVRSNGPSGTELAAGNQVRGNYIGVNAAGNAGLAGANAFGIVAVGARGIAIGTGTPAGRNVISGNNTGVVMQSDGFASISGNYIGTNSAGTAAIANEFGGTNNVNGGVSLAASSVDIRNNVLSGNGYGVVAAGIGTNNVIRGNIIGLNADGTAQVPNDFGIFLTNQARDTRIGGDILTDRNIISGNNQHGVHIGPSTQNNRLFNNYIGTDITGNVSIGNRGDGVRIQDSVNNSVGGDQPRQGNVISGNGSAGGPGNDGLVVMGQTATGNRIQGNLIGTNAAGTGALPNLDFGVTLSDTTLNLVGGDTPGARNVISGNGSGAAIYPNATANRIEGNYIGTTINGQEPLSNSVGIFIQAEASNNTIGGTTAGQRNVVSGNGVGISIQGNDNVVAGNYVGVAADGTTALANGRGVVISGSGNIIGGGAVNVVASNTNAGVAVIGDGVRNNIADNRIFNNGGLGIDLGDDGVTDNDVIDTDDGPNNLQNFPVITSATTTGLIYEFRSTPNTSFTVRVFVNLVCQATGDRQGAQQVDTHPVTTDANGFATLTRTVSLPPDSFVTTTATDPAGNTSEFSACAPVIGEGATTVTVVANDASADEAGPDPGSFTFTRTGPVGSPLNVTFTLGGTATTDVDYINTIGTLVTIPANQSSISVNFTPLLDALVEDDETVIVTITPGAYSIGTPNSATATINENTPTVTVTAQDATAVEAGADPGVLRFARTGPTVAPLNVPFTLGGTATPDVDFSNTIGTLSTIPAGQSFIDVQFTPTADGQTEGSETVVVTLLAGTYVIGSPNTATVTITDTAGGLTGHWEGMPPVAGLQPLPPIACPGYNVALDLTQTSGTLSGTAWVTPVVGTCTPIATIEQSNGQRSANTVTGTISGTDVNFTILGKRTNGGVPNAVSAVIVTGTVSGDTMTHTATVAPIRTWTDLNGDLLPQCDLTQSASNGECGESSGLIHPANMSVARVPTPTADLALTLTDAPDPVVAGANVVYTFVTTNRGASPANGVTLTGNFDASLSFVSASGGCVFGQPCALGTLLPGDVRNITVTMLATAAGSPNASGSVSAAQPDPLPGNNSDTETTTVGAPVVTLAATDPGASEVAFGGPDVGVFTFTRTGPTTSPLIVNYTIGSTSGISGSDYTPAVTGTFTIPAGLASADLTITPVLDALIEGTENLQLTLAAGAAYVIGSPNTGTVFIADAPVITIQATDASASEAGSDPGTFTITSSSTAAVTVNFTAGGSATAGTDYTSLGVNVVKPTGVTTVTLTVSPLQDGVPEGAEDVTVTLASGLYAIGAANTATVTIADSAALTVVNTGDAGPGSLRQAILNANANPDASVITFALAPGPQTISPTSALPTITAPITIDGTTQSGFSGTPLIELSGALAGGSGLTVSAAGSVVRGLVINQWLASGIRVEPSASGAIIEGNYVGVNSNATAALGNAGGGISVFASNVRVGGVTAGSGNVIAGNDEVGVLIGNGTSGVQVLGNLIGTNAAGASGLGNGGHGVSLSNSNNTIGSVGPGRNVISGNQGSGISLNLNTLEANNNSITGNYIGLNPAGTAAVPNQLNGIFLGNRPISNTNVDRNVISGNAANGISALNAGTLTITGNFIGTNPAGTVAIPNVTSGINFNSTSNSTIGGTTPAARNIISGNTGPGVIIQAGAGTQAGVNSTGNTVLGNYIGTDTSGNVALPNGSAGVLLSITGNVTSTNHTIGGTSAGARNVISGNGLPANPAIGHGIEFTGGGSSAVQGNFIGTNASGTAAVPNHGRGINIDNSNNNLIGGASPGAGNLISGNGAASFNAGLQVTGTSSGNQIFGNFIGTDFTGTSGIPNYAGVLFSGSNSIFGGPGFGEGNVVAFNTNTGVLVWDNSVPGAAVNNRIRGNQIFSNGLLGIDLGLGAGANGPTPNDAGDGDIGPNNRQNFPVVTQVAPGVPTIQGTLNSLANTVFALDFYASTTCDASGFGEGQRYLGTFSVNTDGSGNAVFSGNVANAPIAGEIVTATATDPSGNTSEFSGCFQLSPTLVQVFTSANGSESGPTPGSFMVLRSGIGPFPLPLDVNLSLTGGTATPESDFAPVLSNITVTIPANLTSVTVPITVFDDDLIEEAETVRATVQAGAGYVPSGDPATLTIIDNDGVGQIAGTVTTGGDTSLSFAFMYVYDAAGTLADIVVTDVDGNYLTNMLPPGNYFVRARTFQNYVDELYNNVVCSPECTVTTGTAIAVSAGQITNDIDFDLDVAGIIGGTVTSTSSGLGVPFATIELRRQGVTDPNLFIYRQTDDVGFYEVFGLAPGNYFVRTMTGLVDEVWNNITCVGCDPTDGTPIPVTIASVTTNINFSLADGARITGSVFDASNGQPLSEAPVQIFTAAGQLVGTALTDIDGNYSSTGLTPGNYFARTRSDFIGPEGVVSGIFGYADELFNEIDCSSGCTVTSGTAITVGGPGTVTSGVNFTLTPPVGQASITATDTTAVEGSSNVATFTVTVSGPTTSDRFALVIVTGGTATSNDYTLTSPDMFMQDPDVVVLRIPAGQSSSTLTLTATDDAVVEGPETVELTAGITMVTATISD